MPRFAGWLVIGAAWMLGSFGSGAALAWLYKRLHPDLAFYKLWAFWTAVLGGAAALVLAFTSWR
ncbi:MAG TPA: hypothetical protein VFE05_12305 [Longimicrobiaceae bacterium]|nr:hypothetical protein [Longimicrobiaceae bacterium]